jgi:hypothetical protein
MYHKNIWQNWKWILVIIKGQKGFFKTMSQKTKLQGLKDTFKIISKKIKMTFLWESFYIHLYMII